MALSNVVTLHIGGKRIQPGVVFTRLSQLLRKLYQRIQENLSFYALTILFPSVSRLKSRMKTRAKGGDSSNDRPRADISRTGPPRKFVFTPSPVPLPKAVTALDGFQQGLRPFIAALLLHLSPLTAWILISAPVHIAALSCAKKKDVKSAEVEFREAYGDVGVMIARQHILQSLVRVCQDLQLTAYLMRSKPLSGYGCTAATHVWDAIFATYNAKSDFVCNRTMALMKLLENSMTTTSWACKLTLRVYSPKLLSTKLAFATLQPCVWLLVLLRWPSRTPFP